MGKAHIGQDEHVLVAGMTGSGKSFLVEIYLAGAAFPYVVMLDTKGQVYERRKKKVPLWRGLVEGVDFTVVERLQDLDRVKTDKIIYAPIWQEQNQEHYNSLLEWVYRRENTTLWIDELMEVAPGPNRYPDFMKANYTRGRSKNVGIWACTQRTLDIPTIAIANTSHFFIFNLNQPQDRKRMMDSTGVLEFNHKPGDIAKDKYSFWYFKDGGTKAELGKLDV